MVKIAWASAVLVAASVAVAQQAGQGAQKAATPPKPTGTVTGHVFANDTQRPARFAQVVLLWKKPKPDGRPEADDEENKAPTQAEMLTGRSELDGSFTIPNVPEGDYYIFGEMAGYVFPFKRISKDELDDDDDVNMGKAIGDVPVIHVSADWATNKEITIRRGAVISGRVTYDDGSPGTTMLLNLESDDISDPLNGNFPGVLQNAFLQSRGIVTTNDRGEFRIANVPPGKYRVSVTIVTENNSQWADGGTMPEAPTSAQRMTIYAPGKFRKSEAQVIDVKGDEEIQNMGIKIALDMTHTVTGFIFAKEDHHAPNHSVVELNDPTGELPERRIRVNEQGQFHFSYVPPGTYELSILGMDSFWGLDPHRPAGQGWMIGTRYKPVNLSVIVGDHDMKVDDVLVEAIKPATP